MTAFLPAVGDMLCGIVFISHANVLKFGLITDTHYIEYPDEFMELMHEKIQDFIDCKFGRTHPSRIEASKETSTAPSRM